MGGLFIRLLFFISDGHNSDFDFFEQWTIRMNHFGFRSIYEINVDRFECDYPPLYLYVLQFWGWIFSFLQLEISSHLFDSCLKLSTLIAEIVFFIFLSKKGFKNYFLVLLAISPVTILNAYGWGQIDLLYSMLLVASCIYLFEKNFLAFAILIALSLNLKTQTLLYFPLLAVFFFKSDSGFKLNAKAILVFIFVFILPNIPFLLNSTDSFASIEQHFTASGRYNFISVNAFNIWWAAFADFTLKKDLLFPPNDVVLIFNVSRKIIALGSFTFFYLIILFLGIKYQLNKVQKITLLAYLSITFFMLLPEMHERYLFPFFIFSAWLCVYYKNELFFFLIFSILHSINLLWGWGEQKYFLDEWMFETTRVVAFITFIIWVLYSLDRIQNFRKLKEF